MAKKKKELVNCNNCRYAKYIDNEIYCKLKMKVASVANESSRVINHERECWLYKEG